MVEREKMKGKNEGREGDKENELGGQQWNLERKESVNDISSAVYHSIPRGSRFAVRAR